MDLQDRVFQNLIKLFHDKREFGLSFFNFALMFMFLMYIDWPSVLITNNVELHTPGAHDSKAVKIIYIEEKFILRSTLNPGLA